MKKMWTLILVISTAILLAAGLFVGVRACSRYGSSERGRKVKPSGDAVLEMVELSVYNAMYMPGSHTYTVKFQKNKATITVHCFHWGQDECYTEEIPSDVADSVRAMIAASEVLKWNGYHGNDTRVLDGGGFAFRAAWSDGTTVDASGSNAYPDGYRYVSKVMHDLFRKYEEKYEYERVPKVLKSDHADCALVNFMQKGNSGYSSYEFDIRESTYENGYTVTAKIQDYTGEFFKEPMLRPADKIFVWSKMEKPDLSPIAKVIRKYKVFKINGYDVAAKDYNNSEWFQISVSYDSDEHVNVMGTEHFEDYDAFRHDMIQACLSIVAQADIEVAEKLK